MWLERHLGSKLMHSQLLDNLKKINLFAELALRDFEQEIVALLPLTAAAAIPLVKSINEPKALEFVCKSMARLDLILDLVPRTCLLINSRV